MYVWLGKLDTCVTTRLVRTDLPLSENLVLLGVWYGQIRPSETLFDDRADLASVGR